MVRKIMTMLGFAILAVALWKIFGGDPVLALSTVWDFVWNLIQGVSDIIVPPMKQLFHL